MRVWAGSLAASAACTRVGERCKSTSSCAELTNSPRLWLWQEPSFQAPIDAPIKLSTRPPIDWDWQSGFAGESNRALTVEVGQTVQFTMMKGHNIVVVSSKEAFDACSFAYDAASSTASAVTPSAESTYTWSAPSRPAIVYLVCGIGTHCIAGERLAVTVVLADGNADASAAVSSVPTGTVSSVPTLSAAASAFSAAPKTVAPVGLAPALTGTVAPQRVTSLGCGQQLAAGWMTCVMLSTLCVVHVWL